MMALVTKKHKKELVLGVRRMSWFRGKRAIKGDGWRRSSQGKRVRTRRSCSHKPHENNS